MFEKKELPKRVIDKRRNIDKKTGRSDWIL